MHKAINAKFKKGDKVVSSDGKYHGVVWDVYGDGEIVVKCEEDDPLTRRRFDQNRLKLANWSTANSVVAKAVANARAANSSAEQTVAKNELDIWKTRKDELNEIHDIASFEDREFSKLGNSFLSVVDKIEGKWTACKERMLKKATSSSGIAKSDLMRIASACEDGRDRMIRARKLISELLG